MTDQHWVGWWKLWLCISTIIAFIGGIWVCIGGLFDLRKMYKRLGAIKRDALDDGHIVDDPKLVDDAVSNSETSELD